MRKRDIKNIGWFADFEARCRAQGYSVRQVFLSCGMSDSRLSDYRYRNIPTPRTRLKLENALATYVPPAVKAPVTAWPDPPEPKKMELEKMEPERKPRSRCNGDKIDCPYFQLVDEKHGYCPLPRCVMKWRE